MQTRVDHVVVNVLTAMDDAVRRFAALGFAVSERGYHSLGSINHVMLFEHDYLELVGIEAGAAKIRREVADGPMGLNGLVLRSDDVAAVQARLQAVGVATLPPVDFERPVEVDGRPVPARFTTLRLAPEVLPAGRVYFCRHHTPELVWRRPLVPHPNGACGIAGFTVVAADPASAAARWARVLGVPPRPDGTVRFDVGGMALHICTPAHYRKRYGALGCGAVDADPPRTDLMGAFALRTTSLEQARECLRAAARRDSIVWHDDGTRLTVAAASAFDAPIEFVAA